MKPSRRLRPSLAVPRPPAFATPRVPKYTGLPMQKTTPFPPLSSIGPRADSRIGVTAPPIVQTPTGMSTSGMRVVATLSSAARRSMLMPLHPMQPLQGPGAAADEDSELARDDSAEAPVPDSAAIESSSAAAAVAVSRSVLDVPILDGMGAALRATTAVLWSKKARKKVLGAAASLQNTLRAPSWWPSWSSWSSSWSSWSSQWLPVSAALPDAKRSVLLLLGLVVLMACLISVTNIIGTLSSVLGALMIVRALMSRKSPSNKRKHAPAPAAAAAAS